MCPMAGEQYPHLRFDRYFTSGRFRNPRGGVSAFKHVQRERESHGSFVKSAFTKAVETFRERAKTHNRESFSDDIIYLEFESEPGYQFKTDRFDNGHGYYQLSYSKTEKRNIDGEEKEIQKIGVFINKKGVRAFLIKLEEFLNPTKDTEKGNPKHQDLLANIASVRAATLECFWTEPTEPFPKPSENIWWEVWLRREPTSREGSETDYIREVLRKARLDIAERQLLFPEHIVIMVRGTVEELSHSLLYTDKLSELRKPKETGSFFLKQGIDEQVAWLEDFKSRIVDHTDDNSVLVCLLDSGVNRGHPLLARFLPEQNMYTIKPDWGTADAVVRGHGTQMAGNALWGDLTGQLVGSHQIHVFHRLESVKMLNPDDPHQEKLYGAITIEAASQPVIEHPNNNRVYCMAITSGEYDHQGEPSSWSSAVDQLIFGEVDAPNQRSLFLISAGNVLIEHAAEYPAKNERATIEDPAQALNAVTVGAYTEKDQIDQAAHPDGRVLARRGSLSPWSRTGVEVDRKWANKPDVVFEGGNIGYDSLSIIEPDTMKILTVGHDPQSMLLSENYATSAATALASKFMAELYAQYPEYWPETIRGLMIHSSDWTRQMLEDCSLKNSNTKARLLRKYGYGVPDFERAIYSARNRLTLIAERTLQPYHREGSKAPKVNEYHMHELPWPVEALESLLEENIRVNVTLSYFIEPNPGRKEYSESHLYQSAGLRFKMCTPNETEREFAARINKLARDDDYETGAETENWTLGPKVRDKGSIHRDWLQTTGPELATKNKIAVFPVGGWWKTRKKLKRYDELVHYSLIVSIDTPDQDIEIDLYTPVKNQIRIAIQA